MAKSIFLNMIKDEKCSKLRYAKTQLSKVI